MLSEQHAADMARGELCLAALGVLLEVTDAAAAASDATDGEMYWVDDLTGGSTSRHEVASVSCAEVRSLVCTVRFFKLDFPRPPLRGVRPPDSKHKREPKRHRSVPSC